MKEILFSMLLAKAVFVTPCFTQHSAATAWKNIYRSTPEKINSLVHTRLDVKFDFAKRYLYGKAWITLKPHFYETDSLRLDAKGMDIHEVSIVNNGKQTALPYTYTDNKNLRIKLDRTYTRNDKYTVYIRYTAKPDELRAGGSAAIKSDKGLYFINPLGEDTTKPIQVWTQGETEASSVWFPTIDQTNQKTTQEIAMTVPAKFVSLSNGKLVSQKTNADGTRTDTWKMDLPHAPYLFFMGVGDYAVVKDTYKGREVSYYLEKPYAKVARRLLGMTPEMMKFFSEKLGVEFPWVKYAQMTARDYVSGAMENTTATLHTSHLQQNARELSDEHAYEDYISHELFHQWFGDLVTTESWSNLALNESFATYGEVLWKEYKYGKEAAQQHHLTHIQQYLASGDNDKDLIRFKYHDHEEMFDRVSYQKGAAILHMLRHLIGDDAFFKSLNVYLDRYKFKTAEAHDLRLVLEEVTGKDLNWFFNQWFFNHGHPQLDITYSYDEGRKSAKVVVKQMQDSTNIFRLPVSIAIYEGDRKTTHQVWVRNASDSFSFAVAAKPSLINFDADKILVLEKRENKTIQEYRQQYRHADNYVDRREAIDFSAQNKDEAGAKEILVNALGDKNDDLRRRALYLLESKDLDPAVIKLVERIATSDEKRLNRAAAIDILAQLRNPTYRSLFLAGTRDSSYSIAGSSLLALAAIDEQAAVALLPELRKDAKGRLNAALEELEVLTKTDGDFEEMTRRLDESQGMERFPQIRLYFIYLRGVNDVERFKKGVDRIVAMRDEGSGFNPRVKEFFDQMLLMLKDKRLAGKNASNAAAIDQQAAYIDKVVK